MPRLFALCASLLLSVSGCTEGSQARECEPSLQVGCGEGERCTLNEEGAPSCRPSNSEGAQEGERCEQSEGCVDGLACLSLSAVPQCARFCALDQGGELADAQCAEGSPYARCLAKLPERADIGVCVTPCDPFDRGGELLICDDDQGAKCGVHVDLPFLICVPKGQQGTHERCDSSAPCEQGLLCLREGDEQRCVHPLPPGEACPSELLKREAHGYYDPLSGGVIEACWPSVSVPQSLFIDLRYRLTLASVSTQEERSAVCAEWGGALAVTTPTGLLDSLSASLSRLGATLREVGAREEGSAFGVWVAGDHGGAPSCLIEQSSEGEGERALEPRFTLSDSGCDPSWPTLCSFEVSASLP